MQHIGTEISVLGTGTPRRNRSGFTCFRSAVVPFRYRVYGVPFLLGWLNRLVRLLSGGDRGGSRVITNIFRVRT